MNVGEVIKRAREQRGWTQNKLARQAGVAQSLISRLEAGQRVRPSAQLLQPIAVALDLTLEDLLGTPSTPADTLDQLRAEGVPPDVLERLERAAPRLSRQQWDLLVAVALDMAGREPERRPQRGQRPVAPAEPEHAPEREEPPGEGRISARGHLRRAAV